MTALLAGTKDEDSFVRSQSVWALGDLGFKQERVIDALLLSLRDGDWEVRREAITALAKLEKDESKLFTMLVPSINDRYQDVSGAAISAIANVVRQQSIDYTISLLQHNLNAYRIIGAEAIVLRDSLSTKTVDEIDRFRNDDKRPWVRLGANYAYELIRDKEESEKKATAIIKSADSLLSKCDFLKASEQYEKAYYEIKDYNRADSLKSAFAIFQEARCNAMLKRSLAALDNLEIAFGYNTALRDTLQAQMARPEHDWKILEGNWYLQEVLLKKR